MAEAARPSVRSNRQLRSAVCTIGCMVGPPIGGVLYDAGLHWFGRAWAFRLPFLVCSAVPLLLMPCVPSAIPQRRIGEIEGATNSGASVSADAAPASDTAASAPTASAPAEATAEATASAPAASPASAPTVPASQSSRKMLLSPSIILGLFSIALSGTLVATLDPTLSIRLSADPFHFSAVRRADRAPARPPAATRLRTCGARVRPPHAAP